MKIFTLVTLNRVEDSESVTLKHFTTREEALAALREAAEDDIENLKADDLIGVDEDGEEEGTWCHDDITDGMTSYSSWEDGYECHNHFSLSIEEKEFGVPVKVRTVCGRELINGLDDIRAGFDYGPDDDELDEETGRKVAHDVRTARKNLCGALVQRTFGTKAEAAAYCAGREDAEGWEKIAPGADYGWIPDEVWDESELNRAQIV